jgi:hypothetical protein
MKLKTPAIIGMFLLALAPAAEAEYDQRLGAHVSHYQWAEFYADTAMRQVREGQRGHCGFHGGHWSPDHYTHFNWALGTTRHKGWVVIDRRSAALAKCRARHGSYYRGGNHHYPYHRPDFRRFWFDFRHGKRYYGHYRHGYRHDGPGSRHQRRDYGHGSRGRDQRQGHGPDWRGRTHDRDHGRSHGDAGNRGGRDRDHRRGDG